MYPSFLSDINETWIFLNRCSENIQISTFMKIRSMEAEVIHEDRRTDGRTERRDKAFCNFAKAPPKTISSTVVTHNVKSFIHVRK